jgi:aryl-alcohol dehydrogenase-like predicted oxidoreductase
MRPDTQFTGDDLRPKFQQPRYGEYLAAIEELSRYAHDRYNRSVLALAVRWVLDRGNTIALWGARLPDQLASVADATGWSLGSTAMDEIDAILQRHIKHPVGSQFMAPPQNPVRQAA